MSMKEIKQVIAEYGTDLDNVLDIKVIKLPVFMADISVAVCSDISEESAGRTLRCQGGNSVILLRKDTSMGVLTHEVGHAVFHLMRSIGVSLLDESEEVYCYIIGYLVDECMKMLEKYGC